VKKFFAVTFLFLLFLRAIYGAPPRDPDYLKNKPPDFKPCGVISEENSRALRRAIKSLRISNALTPATTYQILVIRVDFPERAMTLTKSQTEDFFRRMKEYYWENSYGIITTSAVVTNTVYRLSSITYYNDENDTELSKLLNDSVNAALAGGENFTGINHIMIYHSGYGEEDSGTSSDIWSMYVPVEFTVSAKKFNGFTIVPELGSSSDPLGVICHEYGHQLGLPDLYETSTTGGTSTCGTWSLMDYPYGYDRSGKPPPLDMWSKDFLNWVNLDSRKITSPQPSVSVLDTSVAPASDTTGYIKIPIEVGTANEYFIVEYRVKGNLKYNNFPSTGVVIWHIDDTVARDPARLSANNINTSSYLSVDLVEADGKTYYPWGKSTDVFPTGKSEFLSPLSDAFNGTISGVSIGSFFLYNTAASFKIDRLLMSDVLNLARVSSYPNPAGTGYFHPRGAVATINFVASRVPQRLDLGIYNVTGERILNIPKDKIAVRMGTGGSTDGNLVYEYDWDGRDETGTPVSPGIYIYRVRADDLIKTGRMVIER